MITDDWRDAFVLRARMRDVPGERIGEALAEVEAHCAESGETPDEAFGDPVAYAQTLADQLAPEIRADGQRLGWARTAFAGMSLIGAVACLLGGADALAHHTSTRISDGTLISTVIGGVCVVGFFAIAERASRRGQRWALAPLLAVAIAAVSLPPILAPEGRLVVSGWVALAAAALLFGVGLLALGPVRPDRIVDPRTGAEPTFAPRWALLVIRFGPLVLIAAAVVIVIAFPGKP
jgi:hypothetical protein